MTVSSSTPRWVAVDKLGRDRRRQRPVRRPQRHRRRCERQYLRRAMLVITASRNSPPVAASLERLGIDGQRNGQFDRPGGVAVWGNSVYVTDLTITSSSSSTLTATTCVIGAASGPVMASSTSRHSLRSIVRGNLCDGLGQQPGAEVHAGRCLLGAVWDDR